MEIPGFTVIEKVSENSRTESWLARQVTLDRLVIIKRLKPAYAADQKEVRAFIDPARSAARLKHPNIVQIYDVAEEHENHYVIMEHVGGRSVAEIVEQDGPLPEKEALHIAHQVAEALDSAWTVAHIVHRNIKPENIILDRHKNVKIADVGLAKVAGSDTDDDDVIEGTPNYMAPEQISNSAAVDFHADMYGLGAALYHILTGNAPFDELAPMEILQQHMSGNLPDPRKNQPQISGGTVLLMHRLLMKKPGDRYAQWKDVCADISALLNGRTGAIRAPGDGASTLEIKKTKTKATRSAARKDGILSGIRGPSLLFRFFAWLLLWCWLAFYFGKLMEINPRALLYPPDSREEQVEEQVSPADVTETSTATEAEAEEIQETPQAESTAPTAEEKEAMIAADPLHKVKVQLAEMLLERHNTRAVARMEEIMARVPEQHKQRPACEKLNKIIRTVAGMEDIIADAFREIAGQETVMRIGRQQQRVLVHAVAGNRITVTPLSPETTESPEQLSADSIVMTIDELAPLEKMRRLDAVDPESKAIIKLLLYSREGLIAPARATARECGPLALAFDEALSKRSEY